MTFARRVSRKASKQDEMLNVPVLNEPNKQMQVPRSYRDNLLAHYKIPKGRLTGPSAFHITFVLEGVAFGIVSRDGERARLTLHIMELDNEECIKLVGSEIYNYWLGLPNVLTFEELRARYSSLMGAMGLSDVTDTD